MGDLVPDAAVLGPAEERSSQAAAPPAAEPAPAPAPESPVAPLPPAAWGTAPPRNSRRALALLAIALVIVFVISGAVGVGAYFVGNALAERYSPQQAVLDYFAAQRAGSVDGVMANATLVRGDGSFDEFFDKAAVRAMLDIPQNRELGATHVVSIAGLDSATANVTVETVWARNLFRHTFTVRKNRADPHYVFYNTWKVDVTPVTISIDAPNQPGTITMDGLPLPIEGRSVQAIIGFHQLTMAETAFYDSTTVLADGSAGDTSAAFTGSLRQAAKTGIAGAITKAEANCDSAGDDMCPGHRYYAPNKPGYVYYFTLPGHPEIDYNSYVFTLGGDITAGMKVTVLADQNQATASGTCTEVMTVDGGQSYRFTGRWTADITSDGAGTFTAHVYLDCVVAAA